MHPFQRHLYHFKWYSSFSNKCKHTCFYQDCFYVLFLYFLYIFMQKFLLSSVLTIKHFCFDQEVFICFFCNLDLFILIMPRISYLIFIDKTKIFRNQKGLLIYIFCSLFSNCWQKRNKSVDKFDMKRNLTNHKPSNIYKVDETGLVYIQTRHCAFN